MTKLRSPEMRLFRSEALPGQWIGEDKVGTLMVWPAEPRGWAKRTAYLGAKRALEEVEPMLARGSGWPGTRGGRLPLRGSASKPLTIRVTDQERSAWSNAADQREQGLSDWIRDTCNTQATEVA